MNLVSPLPDGGIKTTIETLDTLALFALKCVTTIVPDFSSFNQSNYLAAGFDIPIDIILVSGVKMLAYVVPTFILAYFLFKTREVAL